MCDEGVCRDGRGDEDGGGAEDVEGRREGDIFEEESMAAGGRGVGLSDSKIRLSCRTERHSAGTLPIRQPSSSPPCPSSPALPLVSCRPPCRRAGRSPSLRSQNWCTLIHTKPSGHLAVGGGQAPRLPYMLCRHDQSRDATHIRPVPYSGLSLYQTRMQTASSSSISWPSRFPAHVRSKLCTPMSVCGQFTVHTSPL